MKNEVLILGNNIAIACEGQEIVRPLSHICYCEAICHNCAIFFKFQEDPQKAIIGINELALLLPKECFYMCHKSYIVHFDILNEAVIKGYKLLFHDQTLLISRYKLHDFWQKAIVYFSANA
jgi:DNA-binding LytR/AlgR family response regulator